MCQSRKARLRVDVFERDEIVIDRKGIAGLESIAQTISRTPVRTLHQHNRKPQTLQYAVEFAVEIRWKTPRLRDNARPRRLARTNVGTPFRGE